ncbi:MAG: protease family protein [Acidobacteriota bacterium]|nr:protease family protein [Acidobacteriota bacterium]
MNTPPGQPPGAIYCSKCWKPIDRDAIYCPHCNSYQNHRYQQERLTQTNEKWIIIKSIIIFYSVYLASIIPLYWIDNKKKVPGLLIISCLDAVLISSFWWISRTSLRDLFRFNRETLKYTVFSIGALFPLLMVDLSYHNTIARLLGEKDPSFSNFFITSGFGFGMMVFIICLMPAIWEEIAFRGLIQTRLDKKFRKWEVIYITAGMFAIIHAAPISWPYLFLLGVVLGLFRWYSRSLWPCMVLHFLHNFIVLYLDYKEALGH